MRILFAPVFGIALLLTRCVAPADSCEQLGCRLLLDRVARIIETALYVEDLARARAFYQNVFGLKPLLEQDGQGV